MYQVQYQVQSYSKSKVEKGRNSICHTSLLLVRAQIAEAEQQGDEFEEARNLGRGIGCFYEVTGGKEVSVARAGSGRG